MTAGHPPFKIFLFAVLFILGALLLRPFDKTEGNGSESEVLIALIGFILFVAGILGALSIIINHLKRMDGQSEQIVVSAPPMKRSQFLWRAVVWNALLAVGGYSIATALTGMPNDSIPVFIAISVFLVALVSVSSFLIAKSKWETLFGKPDAAKGPSTYQRE